MWDIILAIGTLIGTIVGAGIFGLPYAALKSGFAIFVFELIILFLVVLFLHLFYGEIVAKTPGKHRLVGYVKRYLGKKYEKLAFITSLGGMYGALLVFLALGSQFTNRLLLYFFQIDNFILSAFIFYFLSALFLFFSIKTIATAEFILSLILFGIILILIGISAEKVNPSNLSGFNLNNILFPYGIILFALSGASAIPEIKELIKKSFLKIIFWGTIIPAILYFLFVLAVLGSTGEATTKDSLGGLAQNFGNGIILWIALLGLASIFSSFLTIGDNLKKIFWYDLKINHFLSWFLTISLPLILFLLKFQDFTLIMNIVGSVAIGAEGIFIILLHKKIQNINPSFLESGYSVPWGKILRPILMVLLILGAYLSIIFSII